MFGCLLSDRYTIRLDFVLERDKKEHGERARGWR